MTLALIERLNTTIQNMDLSQKNKKHNSDIFYRQKAIWKKKQNQGRTNVNTASGELNFVCRLAIFDYDERKNRILTLDFAIKEMTRFTEWFSYTVLFFVFF